MIDFRDRDAVRELIKTRHWIGGESIRSIERSLGVGKTVLSKWCNRHGLAVRPRVAQTSITNSDPSLKPRGKDHWAFGLRKETSAVHAEHSERMRTKNPVHIPGVRERMNVSLAATFRRKPTAAEAMLSGLLRASGVHFAFQYPIEKAIIDFAFPPWKVGVEVDGKGHGSRKRQLHDGPRDLFLVERGWKILRIRQENIVGPAHLFRVLKKYIPDLEIPGGLPPSRRQYRVLVRDAESPSGRKE